MPAPLLPLVEYSPPTVSPSRTILISFDVNFR